MALTLPSLLNRKTANLCLRALTLAMRFLLVVILAKFLSVAEVGFYGLFAAAIFYGVLFFGLDMYVFTTREIAKTGKETAGGQLKDQAIIVVFAYLALAPLTLALLPRLGLPSSLIYWFVPILIFEHLNQEIFRLLTVLQEQLTASLLLFIRQGSWVLILIALFWSQAEARSLEAVLMLWLGASVLAALGGIWKLSRLGLGGWTARVDWGWIRRGLKIAGLFLIATLALRAIQTFDRFFLEGLMGIEVVGAYVLFVSLAAAMTAFIDAAVFAFKYPRLLTLVDAPSQQEFQSEVRQMAMQAALGIAVFIALSVLCLPVLLNWIDKAAYRDFTELFYWALAASAVFTLSMVPHYVLYAKGRDTAILFSQLAAMLIFFAASALIASHSPLYAVPIGVALAMSTLLVCKTAACGRFFLRN
jgi:O-antigen/teichoic acid export membrane protein